jgi:hypothetical protein
MLNKYITNSLKKIVEQENVVFLNQELAKLVKRRYNIRGGIKTTINKKYYEYILTRPSFLEIRVVVSSLLYDGEANCNT